MFMRESQYPWRNLKIIIMLMNYCGLSSGMKNNDPIPKLHAIMINKPNMIEFFLPILLIETLLNFERMIVDIWKKLKHKEIWTVLICYSDLLYLFLTKIGKKDSRLSIWVPLFIKIAINIIAIFFYIFFSSLSL